MVVDGVVVTDIVELEAKVGFMLNDRTLANENWNQTACWGKAFLVSLANEIIRIEGHLVRKGELLEIISDFASEKGYSLRFFVEEKIDNC